MTTIHTVATFARVIRNWAEAVEAHDLSRARFYADQVKAISLLVAVDPAYKTLFEEYAGDCEADDPEHAAKCLRAFIAAATEAFITGRNHGRE